MCKKDIEERIGIAVVVIIVVCIVWFVFLCL